jgi:oligopeptide/dipeptide ABC transporter ATP-binding protein
MVRLRGKRISMILQDPMTALDPVLSIGDQLTEALRAEDGAGPSRAHHRALDLMTSFRIGDPEEKMKGYPHQLSGGMRQRVVGAISISRDPAVLIADEPTTSLDATLQLEYLRLLKQIQLDTGLAILFITHDFGIVERLCDRVAVMYAGRIIETGETSELLKHPRHPYTKGLLSSIPNPDDAWDLLPTIEGEPPGLENIPVGCSFEPRCPFAVARCRTEYPPEFPLPGGRMARCWRLDEIG